MTLPVQRLKPQIPPNRLPSPLHGPRNPKRSMFIGDDVIFVFRVARLVLRLEVDVFDGEVGGTVEGEEEEGYVVVALGFVVDWCVFEGCWVWLWMFE